MATLSMKMHWERRNALYTPSSHNAKKFGLTGVTPCVVLGLFQIEDAEYADALFVAELPDGRCCYAAVESIQFLPEEDEAR